MGICVACVERDIGAAAGRLQNSSVEDGSGNRAPSESYGSVPGQGGALIQLKRL